jgi:YHS domain-containing protein
MPAGQSKSVVVQPAAKLPATAVNVAQQTPPKSGPTGNETRSDGLDDLFLESDASEDATDALDLDALVVSPKAMLAPAIESKPVVATESQPDENATEQNPFEAGESAVLEVVREANPLTGVRLEDSDEELFDAALSKSAATAGKSLLDGGTAAAKEAVAEIDEFGNSLPAIDLPAVEDLTQSVSEVLAQPDLGLPELDAADSAEASTGRAVLNSTEEQKSIPPVELKTVDAASGRNADTERLQQVAEQDRRLKQQRMIQSRAGQTGFKGYCPVELRDRRELVETNAEFTATFGLQTYSFSSAAAKTAFEGDPSRYAPAAGGSDVVLLVNGGEEQPGMLDYALWYRDRLYLFRSRETMAMFNSDPLRFANQY